MPFIEKSRRSAASLGELSDPGDICFRHYKALVDMWKAEPRWTTVDTFAKRIWEDDQQRAAALALLVAFHEFIMDYERKKKKENGEVM